MAIRNKDELLKDLLELKTDENSEAFTTILENISDTMDGMSAETEAKKIEELEEKIKALELAVEEKEKEWREKYISRFYDGKRDNAEDEVEEEEIKEVDENGDGEVSEKELIKEWKEQSR